MFKPLFILLLLLYPLSTQAQWKTETGNNKFDGHFKLCFVKGSGGNPPFNNPKLVINRFGTDKPNIYLADIGYTGCNRNTIRVTFNDDESILMCDNPSYDLNKEVLFIDSFENIAFYDFIEMLTTKKRVYFRYTSSCGQTDYEFSLLGSSNAINYALGDYLSD